jgi:hypothetical protein
VLLLVGQSGRLWDNVREQRTAVRCWSGWPTSTGSMETPGPLRAIWLATSELPRKKLLAWLPKPADSESSTAGGPKPTDRRGRNIPARACDPPEVRCSRQYGSSPLSRRPRKADVWHLVMNERGVLGGLLVRSDGGSSWASPRWSSYCWPSCPREGLSIPMRLEMNPLALRSAAEAPWCGRSGARSTSAKPRSWVASPISPWSCSRPLSHSSFSHSD